MFDSSERKYRFAAVTPLNHKQVMGALLDRVPTYRKGTIKGFVIHIGEIKDLDPVARQAFIDVGTEEDYQYAILVRSLDFGDHKIRVRIWEGLSQDEIQLIDYFNFHPHGITSRDVDGYVRPFNATQITVAHINEYGTHSTFRRVVRMSTRGIAVPIMGLNRMIQAAKDARAEFFSQQ